VLLNDEPTEEIEDKETYHYLDALRYVSTLLAQPQGERRGTTAHEWA
jgi:hypothetical protein